MNKKRSIAHTRRIQAYPRPSVYNFLKAYAKLEDISESKVIDLAGYQLMKNCSPEMLHRIKSMQTP